MTHAIHDRRTTRRWLVDSVLLRLLALCVAAITARLATGRADSLTRRLFDGAGIVGDALMIVFILAIALLVLDIVLGAMPQRAPWLRVLPLGLIGMVYVYLAGASMIAKVPAGGWDLILYYAAVGMVCMLGGLATAVNMLRASERRTDEES